MRIPDDLIEQIKESNPIEDVVGEFVSIRKRGKNYLGLCPFHTEKTPSFTVSPDKGIFHCFGCGAGGNVFTFLNRIHNQGFLDSVRALAQRAHIALPEHSGPADHSDQEREDLRKVNEKAAYVYHYYLLNKPEGLPAREYLRSRNFSQESFEAFQLGFAPDAWDRLYKNLIEFKFSDQIMSAAALIRKSRKDTWYDLFRNRIMIPIFDLSGRIAGFGGRVLKNEPNAPKYINSSETRLFHKSDLLYGLDKARNSIREKEEVVVVEGYFDVIMAHQKGVPQVVAPLGTALTTGHIRVLSRYTRNIILVFDPDAAGEKATWRSIELLLQQDFHVRILRLPLNLDPCDYLDRYSGEHFTDLLSKAPDVFAYMAVYLKERFDLKSMKGKLSMMSYVFKYLRLVSNVVARDLVFDMLAKDMGASLESVKIEFEKYLKSGSRYTETAVKNSVQEAEAGPPDPVNMEFLVLLLLNPDSVDDVLDFFNEQDFVGSCTEDLFREIRKMKEEGVPVDLDRLLNRVHDTSLASQISRVVLSNKFRGSGSVKSADHLLKELFADYWKKLKIRKLDKVVGLIREKIREAEHSGDLLHLEEFQRDLTETISQRNILKNAAWTR